MTIYPAPQNDLHRLLLFSLDPLVDQFLQTTRPPLLGHLLDLLDLLDGNLALLCLDLLRIKLLLLLRLRLDLLRIKLLLLLLLRLRLDLNWIALLIRGNRARGGLGCSLVNDLDLFGTWGAANSNGGSGGSGGAVKTGSAVAVEIDAVDHEGDDVEDTTGRIVSLGSFDDID